LRSLGDSRIAINCLAKPLAGRPTRRARRSSSSVASGMSEKSICESGICLTFFPTRLTSADDPDRFLFMLPPYRVHHQQQPFVHRQAQSFEPRLLMRVGSLFEWHPMFLKIGNGLGGIPIEHVSVYTLIRAHLANEREGWVLYFSAGDCSAAGGGAS
jgi:hypothetical protein